MPKYRYIGDHAIELDADKEGRLLQVGFGDFFEQEAPSDQVKELIKEGFVIEVEEPKKSGAK